MKYFFFLIILFSIISNKSIYSSEVYVVSKVNNIIITNVDVENEYRYLIALNNDLKNIDKKKIMKLAKNSIIREKIKETELKNHFDLNKENKYIDRILANFYKALDLKNEKEFINYLLNYDLLFDEVKKKIVIEAAWNDLIYTKYIDKIQIDEQKIKKKINKLISDKKRQNVYLLSEILYNENNAENNENKYKLIKKSIAEIGFKNTANIHSISDTAKLGGQIGWINESQLSKIIKKKTAKLKIGEYTEPITIPGGILIINLDNIKTQEGNLDFDVEFNKQIIFEKNTQLNQFSKIYYNKISKNSDISEL
jgi:peptidyl-prolyl cis-trans isomerase SurA